MIGKSCVINLYNAQGTINLQRSGDIGCYLLPYSIFSAR